MIEERTIKSSVRKLLGDLLPNLSLTLSANLDSDRVLAYVNALDDLSEMQINHAFKRAVKSWKPAFGRTFPSPAELREYAEELDSQPSHDHRISLEIDPENLPKGWSMEQWKLAKLRLQVSRANAERRLPPDENLDLRETRQDYAKRLIGELRPKISSGSNSL